MTTEQNTPGIQDVIKPSAGTALQVKRMVDVFNILASTPIIFGANFKTAPISAVVGLYSIFEKLGDKKEVNVVTANESEAIRSHRNDFNRASGSFIKNQIASVAMNLATMPAVAMGLMSALGGKDLGTAVGFGSAFLLAVGGTVAGWRAHRDAVEMNRTQTAIKLERLNIK